MAAPAAQQGHGWLPSMQSVLAAAGYNWESWRGTYSHCEGRNCSLSNTFDSIKNVFFNAIKGFIATPSGFTSFPEMHWKYRPDLLGNHDFLAISLVVLSYTASLPSWLPVLLPTCCMTQRIPSTVQNHTQQNWRMRNIKFPLIKFKQRSKINASLFRFKTKDLWE